MSVFFISQDYLKKQTPITANVDVAEIYPFLTEAQERYVKDVLGSKLYDRLIAGATASNLTADEYTLIDYIKPMLANYTAFDALPFISIKLRNKGTLKSSGADMTNADLAELRYLRNEIKDKAEYYLTRLQDYLCKHGNLYSQYISPENPIYPNSKKGYKIDMYLGDSCSCDSKFLKNFFRS